VILVLSGCSSVKPLEISAKPIDRPELVLPSADQLNLRIIDWVIITEENYEEVFSQLRETGNDPVLFGLSDKGYENLSLNLSDVRAFIQQQKTIIAAYERYYKDAEVALSRAQREVQSVNQQVEKENKSRDQKSFFETINPF